MKLKEGVDPVYTTEDFFYSLTQGYINPEEFLEPEDAEKVQNAINILQEFQDIVLKDEYEDDSDYDDYDDYYDNDNEHNFMGWPARYED